MVERSHLEHPKTTLCRLSTRAIARELCRLLEIIREVKADRDCRRTRKVLPQPQDGVYGVRQSDNLSLLGLLSFAVNEPMYCGDDFRRHARLFEDCIKQFGMFTP